MKVLLVFFIAMLNGSGLVAASDLHAAIRNSVPPPAKLSYKLKQEELDKALLLACRRSRTDWIQFLLNNGADATASIEFTKPLRASFNSGSRDAVLMLVRAGAKDYDWNTLHLAAIQNDTNKLAGIISAGAELNQQDASGYTPILLAAHFRSLEAVAMLAKAGVKHTYSPLALSIITHDLAQVESLAKNCLELNKRTDDLTPLMLTALYNNADAARVLIQNGAEIESQATATCRGTALIMTVEKGSTKTLQVLLEEGADPNHMTSVRDSALAIAVFREDIAAIRLLLDKDANPDLSRGDGSSARDYARRSKNEEIRMIFENK